jgi:hypothetical protein
LIGENLHATRSRVIDPPGQLRRQSPTVLSERLHVADDANEVSFFSDADDFVDRGDDADVVVAFVPDVTRVDASELAGDGGERDDFFCVREAARRVEKSARETERPLFHRAPDEAAHALQLVRPGLTVLVANDLPTHTAVTDELGDVGPDSGFLELDSLQGEVDGTSSIRVGDDGGDALREERPALTELAALQSFSGVRVHVDESWGYQPVARVNDGRCARAHEPSDRHDSGAGDPDVCAPPRIARAVHDTAVLDQNIERRRPSRLLDVGVNREGDEQKDSWRTHRDIVVFPRAWVVHTSDAIRFCIQERLAMSDATMNLTVPRGTKSVWDAPRFGSTLSTYDQERWLAAAIGSTLTIIGARSGGFRGGLLATLGSTLAIRAAIGRRDLRVVRGLLNDALKERGWRPKDVVEDASADSFPASDSPSWTADSGATIGR